MFTIIYINMNNEALLMAALNNKSKYEGNHRHLQQVK